MRNLFLFLFLFISFPQNILGEDILTELLVATPNMPDPRFKETVIFMFYHNKEGAAGLATNNSVNISSLKIFCGNDKNKNRNKKKFFIIDYSSVKLMEY